MKNKEEKRNEKLDELWEDLNDLDRIPRMPSFKGEIIVLDDVINHAFNKKF